MIKDFLTLILFIVAAAIATYSIATQTKPGETQSMNGHTYIYTPSPRSHWEHSPDCHCHHSK